MAFVAIPAFSNLENKMEKQDKSKLLENLNKNVTTLLQCVLFKDKLT